ncbi:MAG: hypothetical protein D6688_05465, partial [Alphaproteobacteria bacterium]
MQLCRKIMIALAAAAACMGATADRAVAKRLDQVDGPAELPPPGYAGRQYIDSQGCAFVRAGVGARTVWIPRVTRDGQVLCGLAPSIARAAPTRSAPAPAAAPSGRKQAGGAGSRALGGARTAASSPPGNTGPIRISTSRARRICKGATPGELRVVPGTSARLRCVAAYIGGSRKSPAPAGGTAKASNAPGSAAPISKRGGAPAALTLRRADVERLCAGYAAGTRLRVKKSTRTTVIRCPVSEARKPARVAAAKPAAKPAAARPRTSAAERSPRIAPMKPPRGFRLAWTDGRLNPLRAVGTPAGEAAMLRVWTA